MRDLTRLLGLFTATAILAAAQSDEVRVSAHPYIPPQLRLTVQSQLVQMDVIVRDPRGRTVGGLGQSDFEILDEGKPRPIAAFTAETRAASAPVNPPPPPSNSPSPASITLPAAKPTPPSRSTLLFFDDLHASPADLQRTQLAAKQFVKAGLGPGARAAVYSVSAGLTLDFTSDAGALTAAIEKIHSRQRLSENGLMPCPRISPYQAFLIVNNNLDALNAAVQEAQQCLNADSTAATVQGRNPSLSSVRRTNPYQVPVQAQANSTWEKAREDSLDSFDAVNKALELLARAPGTRVLLMVSTGFLSGLMDNEKSAAVDRAVRYGIVINAIDAKGLWSEIPGREAQTVGSLPLATFFFETSTIGSRNDAVNAVMEEFASGTGGLFFHNSNDLAGGFEQLGAVPETTYLIAFRPDSEGPAGRYHKLKVRLATRNGDYVQARPGYVTPNAPTEANQESRPIDQLILAADVPAQIPVKLTPAVTKTGTAVNPALSLLIHVDLAALKFSQHDDRHVQKLAFIGAIFDSAGKMVAAKEGSMDFALKDETFTRLTASGVNAGLTLAAPPGSYRVRVVVADAEGKMAALNQTVEIPK